MENTNNKIRIVEEKIENEKHEINDLQNKIEDLTLSLEGHKDLLQYKQSGLKDIQKILKELYNEREKQHK